MKTIKVELIGGPFDGQMMDIPEGKLSMMVRKQGNEGYHHLYILLLDGKMHYDGIKETKKET